MDIRINGLGAKRLAADACTGIFGDDISGGPARRAPQWLLEIKHTIPDQPMRFGVAPVEWFETPGGNRLFDSSVPRCEGPWELFMHTVDIVVDGKLFGKAIRMDRASLLALAQYEQAVNSARKAQGL